MNNFKIEDIKKYYDEADEIWPISDKWHKKTNTTILRYLKTIRWSPDSYVLNAGSGGSDYGLPYRFHHVDISSNRMDDIPLFTRANIEHLPFDNATFDNCICVGSVLNYCDAVAALSELSRVLKTNGELVLEFENSWGYRYRGTKDYGVSASVVTIDFRNTAHTQWIYSDKYISSLCAQYGFAMISKKNFHILSSLVLSLSKDETRASRYFYLDNVTAFMPLLSRHGNNIIYRLKKV